MVDNNTDKRIPSKSELEAAKHNFVKLVLGVYAVGVGAVVMIPASFEYWVKGKDMSTSEQLWFLSLALAGL
jgi:hypothetical protein